MSAELVKQTIARALAEPDFREMLLSDPDKALQGLDLSPDEKMSLRSLTRAALEALALPSSSRVTRPPSLSQ